MATLAEIRAKLLAQETTQTRDDTIFLHWKIPDNSTTTVRFLPDNDPTNDYFWRTRLTIKIPFSGVKGHNESSEVTVQVPCVETWGEKCPILSEIQPWWKDPSMEHMARKYWKKRSYMFQGFVVDTALSEDNPPENPIRRFVISPQIYQALYAGLMDPDMGDDNPTDYDVGVDFKITKTKGAQFPNYSTSSWSRRSRALGEAERTAIDTHGLVDLAEYLPKKPTPEQVDAIFAMFEASVDGQLYDPEKFGNFYKPYGFDMPTTQSGPNVAGATTAATTTAATTGVADVVTSAGTTSTPNTHAETTTSAPADNAADILAAIRARKS